MLVRVTGNNVTLDGFNFGLHGGLSVSVTGGASKVSITNSYFFKGGIYADATAGTLTVSGNTIDGGGAASDVVANCCPSRAQAWCWNTTGSRTRRKRRSCSQGTQA
jgi:hypothetical protein